MSEIKIQLKQLDGLALAAYGEESKHWVTMDSTPILGGKDSASRPMELMLMGIAGCSAMDVISILKKKRANISEFRMEIVGERAEEHPKRFIRIDFHYIVTGKEIKPEDVQRAIELTEEKYCGAMATIRGNVELSYRFTINEQE